MEFGDPLFLRYSGDRYFYVHNKLKQLEAALLKGGHEILYTDDDEYWINGTTYNNPNDRSVMVPKRLGIGTTINIGTKTGKSIYYGLCIRCIAVDRDGLDGRSD